LSREEPESKESVGKVRSSYTGIVVGLMAWAVVGCSRGPIEFAPNSLYTAVAARENGVQADIEGAAEDVRAVVAELFGTPDEPKWAVEGVVRSENLARAAGRFYSDEQDVHFGLFRKHCSNCHGVTGDGRGPAAALQNPYPRDFRAGVFKFKSTPRGEPPTRADLRRTIMHGMPGTAMPAFRLLPESDIEAIIDYVVYLAVRGEVERRLLAIAMRDMDYSSDGTSSGDRWLRPHERREGDAVGVEQGEWVADTLTEVLRKWSRFGAEGAEAGSGIALEKEAPPATAEVIAAGRELFHGAIANCSSCHGEEGSGQSRLPADYDDWTKEWTTRLGLDPGDRDATAELRKWSGLRPKSLPARDLTRGSYRAGSEPQALFLRIVQGIDGTPMPAINRVTEPSSVGLTDQQVWSIVHYVRSIGGVE
jgi:mono/diheme cytochrome c family protein